MFLSRLVAWLLGSDSIPVAPIVEPHLADTEKTVYNSGALAIAPMTTNGFMTDILTSPVVGYNTPDIVNVIGTPPAGFVPGEGPVIAQNDATGGRC